MKNYPMKILHKKLAIMLISLISVGLGVSNVYAFSITTDKTEYLQFENVSTTVDVNDGTDDGFLLFMEPYSNPFQCLHDDGKGDAAGYPYTYNQDLECKTFGVYASGTITEFTLLYQGAETCWAGNNDNLAECLARGETLASTTWSIIAETISSTASSTTTAEAITWVGALFMLILSFWFIVYYFRPKL